MPYDFSEKMLPTIFPSHVHVQPEMKMSLMAPGHLVSDMHVGSSQASSAVVSSAGGGTEHFLTVAPTSQSPHLPNASNLSRHINITLVYHYIHYTYYLICIYSDLPFWTDTNEWEPVAHINQLLRFWSSSIHAFLLLLYMPVSNHFLWFIMNCGLSTNACIHDTTSFSTLLCSWCDAHCYY